jgi:hypothetical protein
MEGATRRPCRIQGTDGAVVSARTEDEGGFLEIGDGAGAVGDLAESEAVLASGVLEVGKAKLHGEDEGVKVLAKPVGLLSVVPVGEVGLWIGGVLDNHVLDAVPESGGPFKDALYGGRTRSQSHSSTSIPKTKPPAPSNTTSMAQLAR